MTKALDDYHKKLLSLIREGERMTGMTLQEISDEIGIGYPQGVVNKLKQLESKWYIRRGDDGLYHALKDVLEDIFYFPVLGFAQCGNLRQLTLDDIAVHDRIALSTKTLPIRENEDLQRFFFTRARGNSMEPDIHDGDLVLIRQQYESTPSDKTLLVHDGEPKIKYIKEHSGQYTLFSLNKSIDEVEISDKNDVDVLGVVKMVMSAH